MLYLTETERNGVYSTGDVLFTSRTNNVDVWFTSDSSVTRTGFGLNIRSIPCTDRDNFSETGIQEVQIAAIDILTDAIVTNTESDGNYPNRVRQEWNIVGDENQVYMLFFKVKKISLFSNL